MSTWFPLLIPLNEDFTEYDGFLKILDHTFHVQLSIGNIDDPATYSVSGDWELQQLLTQTNKNFEEVLGQSKSVSHFLMEFCNLVENALKSQSDGGRLLTPSPENLQRIISDLQECGWDNVEYVSEPANEIHMNHTDAVGRDHSLRISIPQAFPSEAPVCESSLPVQYDPPWQKDRRTIKCIYDDFVDKIKDLQPFWNTMDDLDARVWVLDPPKPRVSDCYRRISMGNNMSVVVIINPEAPRALPKMEFTGPEKLVTKLCGSLEKNARKWEMLKSVCENLESVLECEIPSKSTTTMEEIDCACGICYSFLLENAVPEKVCDNSSCSKPFHEGCIYEWMRSLPTVRQNFNMLFGECPYCSEPMSCKIV